MITEISYQWLQAICIDGTESVVPNTPVSGVSILITMPAGMPAAITRSGVLEDSDV